jgi:hypothetical protein
MFVRSAADQGPLAGLLESLTGRLSGGRDALARYTRPVTGAYYFGPSIESLLQVPKRLSYTSRCCRFDGRSHATP